MQLHCTTLSYSYRQTYNDNVSQSILPQKLAVLPFRTWKHHLRSHMGETDTDGYQGSSWFAHECYNFVFKDLIDLVILYTKICIRKCRTTELTFFLRVHNIWANGMDSMEFQCEHNTPTLKERLSLDNYLI